jgi:hypothetical protein
MSDLLKDWHSLNTDEKFYSSAEYARAHGEKEQFAYVASQGIANEINLKVSDFKSFSPRFTTLVEGIIQNLSEKFEADLPKYLSVCQKLMVFSSVQSCFFLRKMCEFQRIELSGKMAHLNDIPAYIATESPSDCASEVINDLRLNSILRELGCEEHLIEKIDYSTLYEGCALLLFRDAAIFFEVQDVAKGLDLIHEADSLMADKFGFYMYYEAEKNTSNLEADLTAAVTKEISARASKAAMIRHKETNSMRKEVFDWLDLNRKKYLSKDKTAEALKKQCAVSFRTLRKWVDEWHNLQSARKV